jgi:Zn-dependent M16 (insulinase) family peptidase
MKGLLYGNNDFEPMRIKELLDKAENADYEALVSKYFLGKGVYGHTVKAARNEITSDRPVNDAPLNRFRAQVNTPEMLKLIQPKSAKDIEARLRWFDYERTDGCIYIESDTDIVYLDLVYPLNTYIDNGLDKGYDFSALNFFCDVALKMDGELQEKSDRLFGRLSLDVDFCADTNNEKRERIIPYLALRTAFLEKNTAQCVDFINGFVQRLDFSDGEKLLRMANETYSTVSAAFRTSSQAFTMIRSMAAVRQSAMLGDYIAGVEYYNYLGTCIANPPQMSKILNYLKNTLPTAVLNCRAEVRDSILDGLKLGRVLPETLNYTLPLAKPCGYAVNTMVNSTAVAMPLDSYNGYMLVAEKIVQSSYLWEKLRLEGGAYGGACKFSRGHALSMYSYRDPQLERTVDAFKGVGKFLATLKLDEDELNRYIIGSAGDMLKPFKAKMINNTVLSQVLLDKSYEKELEYCQSMLSCTIKDINSIGEMVEQSTNDACYVTIGSENISSFYGDNVYKL